MKMAMIGIQGSGKTSFLAGLYEQLAVKEFEDFSMQPASSDFFDNLMEIGRWEEISFRRDGGLEFPDGTQSTTNWSFELYERQNDRQNCVCSIDLIDYRGGLISEIKPGELDQEKRIQLLTVARQIQNCKALILFIDSIQLLYNDLPSINTGVDRMYQILEALGRNYPGQELTILILLTKADGVARSLKNRNYDLLTQEGINAIENIRSLIHRNPRWRGAIVPISAVGEAAKIEPIRKDPFKINTIINEPLTPINIEHAIFYCASYGIEEENTTLRTRIEQNYIETDQMRESIDETQENIARVSRQLQQARQSIRNLEDQLNEEAQSNNESNGCLLWFFNLISSIFDNITRFLNNLFTSPGEQEDLEEELEQQRRRENLLQADLINLERELRIQRDSQDTIQRRQPITNQIILDQRRCSRLLRRIALRRVTRL